MIPNFRGIEIMLYEIVSVIGEKILSYINSPHVENWYFPFNIGMSILHQREKGIGKIHNSWLTRIYFLPLVALWKSNPFFSSVKDWVIQISIGTEF